MQGFNFHQKQTFFIWKGNPRVRTDNGSFQGELSDSIFPALTTKVRDEENEKK